MAKAFFQNTSYVVTPVDELIIQELAMEKPGDRAAAEKLIRETALLVGCSRLRAEQLAYVWAKTI
jgi:hypothetical protein